MENCEKIPTITVENIVEVPPLPNQAELWEKFTLQQLVESRKTRQTYGGSSINSASSGKNTSTYIYRQTKAFSGGPY